MNLSAWLLLALVAGIGWLRNHWQQQGTLRTAWERHWQQRRLRQVPVATLAERIDAVLPQTQCGQCGFAGCRPYAEAIARGNADINQCPPGGAAGVRTLAALLGRAVKPVNPDNGHEKPPVLARIVEADCIGCTKCIQACPVDAIIGAPKRMHTVIAELCTGCELCLPPCPVDCIELLPIPSQPSGQPTDHPATYLRSTS